MRKYLTTRNLIALSLFAFAAIMRFLPHPPNFSPVAAVALFSGVYLSRRTSIVVPLVVMMATDIFLGFYPGIAFTWFSMALVGVIGWWVRDHKSVFTVAGGALLGSVLFFLITNAAVWAFGNGSMYAHTFAGFIQCYVAAIPFFRNTILGDLTYVAAFFGVAELAYRHAPKAVRTVA